MTPPTTDQTRERRSMISRLARQTSGRRTAQIGMTVGVLYLCTAAAPLIDQQAVEAHTGWWGGILASLFGISLLTMAFAWKQLSALDRLCLRLDALVCNMNGRPCIYNAQPRKPDPIKLVTDETT